MDTSFCHLRVVLFPILTANKLRELCLKPDSTSLATAFPHPHPLAFWVTLDSRLVYEVGDLKGTWECGMFLSSGAVFQSCIWLLESGWRASGSRSSSCPCSGWWGAAGNWSSLGLPADSADPGHSCPQPGLVGPSQGIARLPLSLVSLAENSVAVYLVRSTCRYNSRNAASCFWKWE